MSMTYERLSTFDEVAERYHKTKPMHGKNKGKDVRPIADRARDHERIKKISGNCYLLMNGGHYDDVFGYHYRGNVDPTQAEMVALAPICWKRHSDGTETIKIRNGIGTGAHMSHYSFLDRMLPRTMGLCIENGKQYIRADAGEALYLPKCMYVPRGVYDNTNRSIRWNSWMKATDDGSALTFRRDGDWFKLVGDVCDAPKPPRTIVLKGMKARYKNHITSYLEWISVMAPLMQTDDYQYRSQMRNQVSEITGESYYNLNPKHMRHALTKQDHPLRLPMAVDFVSEYGTIRNVQSQADAKQVKAEFNRWINKVCGFTKQVKG
jgi:hypothetical protein